MKRKNFFGTGSTFILMVFVILCLTTFAVLSFTSSSADYRLTKKAAGITSDYYTAECKAIDILSVLNQNISVVGEDVSSDSYSAFCAEELKKLTANPVFSGKENGKMLFSFQVAIDDARAIHVSASIDLVNKANGAAVENFRTITTTPWEESDDLNLLIMGEQPVEVKQ